MAQYVITQAGLTGISVVVEFEGTMMELAQKVTAKGAGIMARPASSPRPLNTTYRRSKPRGKYAKGYLRPTHDGKASARVIVLRSLLTGPCHQFEIEKAHDYSGHSTIRQAVGRNLKAKYCTEADGGMLTLTSEGAAALRHFDAEYPELKQE